MGLGSPVAHGSIAFTLTELRYEHSLPSGGSDAKAINDRGYAAGEATFPSGLQFPRIWRPDGTSYGVDMPPMREGTIAAINGHGDVCGTFDPSDDEIHAFCTQSGTFVDMGLLEGFYQSSAATGLNDSGTVCGWARDAWAVSHAFTWKDNVFLDLHAWDDQYSTTNAYSINNDGAVAGTGRALPYYDYALLWTAGEAIRLPSLPTDFVMDMALGINRDSWATGESWIGSGSRAVLWRGGEAISLGVPAGYSSTTGWDVNDLGQVALLAGGNGKYDSPFLWCERKGLYDLRALAGGMPGWSQVRPFGMNNKGQVVGQGIFEYQPGKTRWTAFKLTPVDATVAPGTATVLLGKKAAGDASSLAALDGDALKVCRFLVPNQDAAPVTVQLDGTLPSFPMNLWLSVTARSANAGAYTLRLDFWDRDALAYDPRDLSTGTLGTGFALQECVAKGDLARYVGPFGEVRSRVRVSTVGPAASAGWCAEFDQAVWHAVPEE